MRVFFVIRVYTPAAFILSYVIPISVHYFLGEDPFRALNFNVLRYTFGLHMVWLVNSGAHKWGMRPYDKYWFAINTSRHDVTKTFFFFQRNVGIGNLHCLDPCARRRMAQLPRNDILNILPSTRFFEKWIMNLKQLKISQNDANYLNQLLTKFLLSTEILQVNIIMSEFSTRFWNYEWIRFCLWQCLKFKFCYFFSTASHGTTEHQKLLITGSTCQHSSLMSPQY